MSSLNSQTSKIYPVILCGGSGTRLWPLSRAGFPKQFIALVAETTLFQDTVSIVSDSERFHPPVIVTSAAYEHIVAKQLSEIQATPRTTIFEPQGRNTAAAIAMAAEALVAHDPSAQMLVLPSDHMIHNIHAFHRVAQIALRAALAGGLVTFGIRPRRPETGYGYIRVGRRLQNITGACHVARFIEKPDLETAESFLESGDYLWNSGMFLFGAERFLAELAQHQSALHDACHGAFRNAARTSDTVMPQAEQYSALESISVDYAVMEKTDQAVVIPADFTWDDIGSWLSLADHGVPDANGNVAEGDVLLHDCQNSFLRGNKRLLTAVGVSDLVIVDTDDALLVAPKNRLQDIKEIVRQLRQSGREEADHHPCVHRPWGTYQGIHRGSRHQVKHIVVEPGQQLSLQYHHHRAEHWIVVRGIAEVTIGDNKRILRENEAVHIPLGVTHRLSNPGSKPMHMIEVQCGSYLGEDDIVRLKDTYNRVPETKQLELADAD